MKYPVALCCLLLSLAVADAKPKDGPMGKNRETSRDPRVQPVELYKLAMKSRTDSDSTPALLVLGTVGQWRVRAEERYPDLKAPASNFRLAFDDAYKVTQEEDPEFLLPNDWPLRIAHIVAQKLSLRVSGSLAAARR